MRLFYSHLAHISDGQIACAYERQMCLRSLKSLVRSLRGGGDFPREMRRRELRGG